MDPRAYKDVKTSRGVNYHYYASPAQDGKPTLIFFHGFPSSSFEWAPQVEFFKKEGYGTIVPDMLGYGGTDKPMTVDSYRMSLMSKDMIDILDAEKVENAIGVGHDWGANLNARLANYYPDRFIAFGFLAVSYVAPMPTFDMDELLDLTEKLFGYPTFGYWKFFAEGDVAEIFKQHAESALTLLYPEDPLTWKTSVAPVGAMKEWLLADKKGPLAPYVTEELKDRQMKLILSGGLAAPVFWYKAMVEKVTPNEEKDIPQEKYVVKKPVFFGATLKDYVCLAAAGKAQTAQLCPDATVVDFDTDHWVMQAAPDQVNKELFKWISGLGQKGEKSSL